MRFLKAFTSIWRLQTAFNELAQHDFSAARRTLEKIDLSAIPNFETTDSEIQRRILEIFLDFQDEKEIRTKGLLGTIRKSNAFNQDERCLLCKYVLTVLWLSRGSRDGLFNSVSKSIQFNEHNIHPTLMSRYGGVRSDAAMDP
jgi:hypothetical protein